MFAVKIECGTGAGLKQHDELYKKLLNYTKGCSLVFDYRLLNIFHSHLTQILESGLLFSVFILTQSMKIFFVQYVINCITPLV